MNTNETIKQYFTRESIVDLFTKYELYYQISLGNYIYETLKDVDETMNKIKELNLKVLPDTVLPNIFEIVLQHNQDEDFEDSFEYHLRVRALLHSLKDFVNNDKELLKVEYYIKEKSQQIINDEFFNEEMKLQLESEYSAVYDHYDVMFTEEIAQSIQENLK